MKTFEVTTTQEVYQTATVTRVYEIQADSESEAEQLAYNQNYAKNVKLISQEHFDVWDSEEKEEMVTDTVDVTEEEEEE